MLRSCDDNLPFAAYLQAWYQPSTRTTLPKHPCNASSATSTSRVGSVHIGHAQPSCHTDGR
eukprot:scaffold629047_cov45-Prasinocladus_malaysianus.AAC.1